MEIFRVDWVIPEGGRFVFDDARLGGSRTEDLKGSEIITAYTAAAAELAVQKAYPKAKVSTPVSLCRT